MILCRVSFYFESISLDENWRKYPYPYFPQKNACFRGEGVDHLKRRNFRVCLQMTWILGFWRKSQNIMRVSQKCKLTATFSAGERFDNLFWKNKVDGTQKFVLTWKLALKVEKPTIDKIVKISNVQVDSNTKYISKII